MLIYHIVLPDVWAAFDAGLYKPSSIASEGFIHCSTAAQLEGVIGRYYSHEERVVVLEIETENLMSRVLNEISTDHEIYPHIYGPINRNAILRVKERRKSPR